MIVLDTDTISELMRPRPSPRLLTRLAELPASEQATTAITLGELAYGAHKAQRLELYIRATTLLDGVHILDFSRDTAEHYGRLRTPIERRGQCLADPDLRIASVVVSTQGTLITGKLKHFSRVPDLVVEDWIHD